MNVKENIAAEFDHFADNYTADMIRCVPHYLKLISTIGTCLPEGFIPKSILDLGCGNGNVTSLLLELFPKAEYTLIDASSEMIEICKKRFKKYSINYMHSYFEDYGFPEQKFDLIAAGFSLHHLDADKKQWLFPVLYKALKKGGMFSCSDLMINKEDQHHNALIIEWGKFVKSNYVTEEKWLWIMDHYEAFDRPSDFKDQKKWLEAAGFAEVSIKWNENYWVNFVAKKN